MNLIDTYVSEVGRHLPQKNRADIEAEIRSTLQDMLEERSRSAGRPVDEEMTLEVLKAYGAPEKVATTYAGERYLIGPRLYPIFLTVVRVVFPVIVVLAGMGAVLEGTRHVVTLQGLPGLILSVLGGMVTAAIAVLGNLVLIFAIIEWALYRSGSKVDLKGALTEKEWDPRSLTKVASPSQIKPAERIIDIVGCFAAIVLFNFYPQIIGFGFSSNGSWYVGAGSWTFVPLLSDAFFRYVPILSVVWILTVVLDIVLLRLGRWNVATHLSAIGLKIVSIVIAAMMLAGPSLIALTPASLTTAIGDAQAAQTLFTIITQVVRVGLWLSIIGGGIDVLRQMYQMFSGMFKLQSFAQR